MDSIRQIFFLHKSKSTIPHYWRTWIVGAVIAICVALSLYLPKYGQLPAGLNRDEVALGYNAYSLLKTGRDEWGKSWPISITSFGDQKLPGYIYTLIPFVAVFGLETWVVRLPSLLAGLIVIVGMGLIASKLAKLAKYSQKFQLIGSWTVMILIAISPWNMHFSRVAYETHLAMAFFVSGLTCWLFALDTTHKFLQKILLIKTGLLAGLTLLTYHSYQIFTPLFLIALLIIFSKKIKKLDKTGLIISIIINLCSIGLLVSGGILQANKIKSQGISPFSNQVLLTKATQYRSTNKLPLIFNKILFNKVSEGAISFAQNYISTFSGTFFFIHGSNHGDHNPGNGNNIHLFLAPFILLGIIAMGKYHKKASIQLITAWILLALIPSSLTTNPMLEVRLGTVFPILELLATIGLFYLLNFLSQRQKILIISLLIIIGFSATIKSFIFYTKIAPQTTINNDNYHKLARAIFKYKSNPGAVLTQSPSSSPYIWYLFENKIDPRSAQWELIHYPATEENFIHVKQLENIYFETINWDNLAKRTQIEPYTLILKPDEFPNEKRKNSQNTLLEIITDANGQTVYEVWKYKN